MGICMLRKPLCTQHPRASDITLYLRRGSQNAEVIFLLALAHDSSRGLPQVALKQCPGFHQPTTGLDNAENPAESEEFLNYLGNGNG